MLVELFNHWIVCFVYPVDEGSGVERFTDAVVLLAFSYCYYLLPHLHSISAANWTSQRCRGRTRKSKASITRSAWFAMAHRLFPCREQDLSWKSTYVEGIQLHGRKVFSRTKGTHVLCELSVIPAEFGCSVYCGVVFQLSKLLIAGRDDINDKFQGRIARALQQLVINVRIQSYLVK